MWDHKTQYVYIKTYYEVFRNVLVILRWQKLRKLLHV